MTNCAVCGHEVTPGSAFCDNCGTPTDGAGGNEPTSLGAALPPQHGQPGSYDGYSQGGYSQGGYSQGDYSRGGYSQGGYGGGGDYGVPPRPKGKGKWIAVWSIVGLVLVVGIVAAVFFATRGGDDNEADGDKGEGGGGEETSTPADPDTVFSDGDVFVGGPATYAVDRGRVYLDIEPERNQIVILATEDIADYSTPTIEDYELTAVGYDFGAFAFQVGRGGEQSVEIEIDDNLDEAEIYVNIIDAEDLSDGDTLDLEDGQPFNAAIFDLDGLYQPSDDLAISGCYSTDQPCAVSGEALVLVADDGVGPEQVETVSATFEGGESTMEYTMPAGGGTVPFEAEESGTVVVRLANLTDGEVDFRLRVLSESGTELCDRDSTVRGDEICYVEVEPGTYTAEITQYNDDESATGDVQLSLE